MISRLPDVSRGIALTGSTVTVISSPRNSATPRSRDAWKRGENWEVGTTRKVTASGAVWTA